MSVRDETAERIGLSTLTRRLDRTSRKRLGLALLIAILGAFAFGLHETVERMIFTSVFGAMTHSDVTAENVSMTLGGFVATNLRVEDVAKSGKLEAARAEIGVNPLSLLLPIGDQQTLEIALSSPHLTLAQEHAPAGLAAIAARLQKQHLGVRVQDGSLTIEGTPGLLIQSLGGEARIEGGRSSYDVRGEVVDGRARYAFKGAAREDAGTTTHTWSARALPLAPLLALAPFPDLVATGGMLRSVELQAFAQGGSPARLHGSATLEDGAFALGAARHALAKLDGELSVENADVGSSVIAGTVDGMPLQLAGALQPRDAQRFVRLLDAVASEPNLQEARLEATAPGIVFAKYRLESHEGRLAIHVASVNPADPAISMNTVLAGDHVTSGGERTSTMGQRTGAALGIDGDYFDIGQSYAPQGIVVRSGTLLRSPVKRMALTVHRGNKVTFDEYRFEGELRFGSRTVPIASINDYPPGKVTVITPEFGKLHPAKDVTFVGLSAVEGMQHRYRVTSVGPIVATRPAELGLAFGKWAGHKPPRPGEIVDLEYGTIPAYDDVVTAIGGGPLMIKDGAWIEDPDAPAKDEHDVRWPVVGVGRLAGDDLLFFEVDGRWPDISVGMTRPEFGALMLRYHVADAMALDSGGSAVIVSRMPGEKDVSVRSHPSDQSYERYVTDALFVYSSAPASLIPLKPTGASLKR